MESLSQHLRSNLYDVSADQRTSHPIADLLALASRSVKQVPSEPPPGLRPALKRRARIWELNNKLHCSIIGTCLSAGELRRLLVRLEIVGAATADEHDLHMLGVLLADRPQEGAKLLHKALDRRHHVTLNQFARAKDEASISALWEKAVVGGDIPGAYWAVLTHADSTDKLVQKAFSGVHMLSHLMGATNCADLQRMRKLEGEVEELTLKLERQQKHLRDGFIERDEKINRLSAMLADRVQTEIGKSAHYDAPDVAALKETITDLGDRLARSTARRERLEQRLVSLENAEDARRRAETERDSLREELELAEHQIDIFLQSNGADSSSALDLGGSTILYVGGRAGQIPLFSALVEHAGGQFVHHDGGIEGSATLLPGLVSRSDVMVFPVDCISHNAMTTAKRTCQQLNKPFVALRTSSLTGLLSALTALRRPITVAYAVK